jgi:hypothetical protein
LETSLRRSSTIHCLQHSKVPIGQNSNYKNTHLSSMSTRDIQDVVAAEQIAQSIQRQIMSLVVDLHSRASHSVAKLHRPIRVLIGTVRTRRTVSLALIVRLEGSWNAIGSQSPTIPIPKSSTQKGEFPKFSKIFLKRVVLSCVRAICVMSKN